MKKKFVFFATVLFAIGGVLSAPQTLQAQDLNGVLDSTFNYTAGAGAALEHSFGFEQFANLRLRVRTWEGATFISAFNVIASTGNFVETADFMEALNPNFLGSTPFIYGQNYAAALELERLYFRINNDLFDTETGLFRMAFGYSQVWGPSDFLNPRNPLSPNARPRGVLGTSFLFSPRDSMDLIFFAAAPGNPFISDGGGFIPGCVLDKHWSRASLQTLYCFQAPLKESRFGIHRFGFSLKADLELGFVADLLYTLNPDNINGIDSLSASAGFDYSFLEGNLYILFEYLFNGSTSATALGSGGFFVNNNFLSGTALYRFNDYSSITFSTVFCFDDLSFQPMVRFDYELFQGFSLNLNASIPLDQGVFSGVKTGEFGPINSRARFILNAGARLRF